MKTYHANSIVWVLLSALMLISCGDGSHGTLTAGGGIGGTGNISRGAITAFGSIVVNGTEFNTSNAVIIVGDEEIGIGDDIVLNNLDIGMVVTVEGTGGEDDAAADRVIYNNNVEGPVESIHGDDPSKEIVVLGQTVIVNVNTEFKGVTFETIAENDVVEVSGFFDDAGAIWATFLEKTREFTPGLVVEVQGFVVNLDAGLETFEINNLRVDYRFADITGVPDGALADGASGLEGAEARGGPEHGADRVVDASMRSQDDARARLADVDGNGSREIVVASGGMVLAEMAKAVRVSSTANTATFRCRAVLFLVVSVRSVIGGGDSAGATPHTRGSRRDQV